MTLLKPRALVFAIGALACLAFSAAVAAQVADFIVEPPGAPEDLPEVCSLADGMLVPCDRALSLPPRKVDDAAALGRPNVAEAEALQSAALQHAAGNIEKANASMNVLQAVASADVLVLAEVLARGDTSIEVQSSMGSGPISMTEATLKVERQVSKVDAGSGDGDDLITAFLWPLPTQEGFRSRVSGCNTAATGGLVLVPLRRIGNALVESTCGLVFVDPESRLTKGRIGVDIDEILNVADVWWGAE